MQEQICNSIADDLDHPNSLSNYIPSNTKTESNWSFCCVPCIYGTTDSSCNQTTTPISNTAQCHTRRFPSSCPMINVCLFLYNSIQLNTTLVVGIVSRTVLYPSNASKDTYLSDIKQGQVAFIITSIDHLCIRIITQACRRCIYTFLSFPKTIYSHSIDWPKSMNSS